MKSFFCLIATLLAFSAVGQSSQQYTTNLPSCYPVDIIDGGPIVTLEVQEPISSIIIADTVAPENELPVILDGGLIQVNPLEIEPKAQPQFVYHILVSYIHVKGFGARDQTGSIVITPEQYWKNGGVLLRALAQRLEIPFKDLVNPKKEQLIILSVDPVPRSFINSTADPDWLID